MSKLKIRLNIAETSHDVILKFISQSDLLNVRGILKTLNRQMSGTWGFVPRPKSLAFPVKML